MVTAMVSPIARPKANIIPPTIPEKAAGTKTRKMVSQRVAPNPKEACLNSGGSEAKESRAIAVIIGRIIILRTIPAGNIPGPAGAVLKIGNHPKFSCNQKPKGLIKGINTKIPQSP